MSQLQMLPSRQVGGINYKSCFGIERSRGAQADSSNVVLSARLGNQSLNEPPHLEETRLDSIVSPRGHDPRFQQSPLGRNNAARNFRAAHIDAYRKILHGLLFCLLPQIVFDASKGFFQATASFS